jgi:hypothetical protein
MPRRRLLIKKIYDGELIARLRMATRILRKEEVTG